MNGIIMKTTKFLLELNGIELPEDVKEKISKSLNSVLQRELGELDLAEQKKPGSKESRFAYFKNIDDAGGKYDIFRTKADLVRVLPDLQNSALKNPQLIVSGVENIRAIQ